MKLNSLKSLESYIYLSVILPLKGLTLGRIDSQSPALGHHGGYFSLEIGLESIDRSRYAHNYQREQASNRAKYLIYLSDGHHRAIVADYSEKTKEVSIFKDAFSGWVDAHIIDVKLEEAFRTHTPFSKVSIVKGSRSSSANPRDILEDVPF